MDHSNVMSSASIPDENITAVLPIESDEEETDPAQTKQQKLIKAGLLFSLVAIIIYVILDYTVSIHTTDRITCRTSLSPPHN